MNRPNRRFPAWLAVGALLALCTPAAAVPIVTAEGLGVPEILDTATMIDVNNIAMFVTNAGGFARDLQSPGGPAGTFFPKGTDKTPIYAAGLWFGSKVNDQVRVTVAEYGLEYNPGRTHYDPQQGQVWEDAALASLKTYKIQKGDTTSSDYLNWPPEAPRDAEGKPLNVGDQTLWAVYNDSDPVPHTNNAGGSAPQNIEVQQTTFAFNRQGPLGNMVFVKFKFYNKGNETLTDCYASLWSDPDLGGAGDDVVGCDTLLSVGYVYNATNNDEMYGARPPCVGYDFFQGPMVPGAESDTAHAFGQVFPGYKNLPMTSFNKYINGTDPDSKLASYNYMQGLTKEGQPLHFFEDPAQPVTKFFDSGDPVKGTGWLDQDPADKRLMLSSGPFTMAPGDSQEVVVAIVIAQATDRLSSVTLMKLYDQRAQAVFDAAFELIPPPPQPTVYVREQDRAIDLVWTAGADNWTSINPGKWDAKLEGYNIYQGSSTAGPWLKIASWDVADTLSNIYRDTFDTDGNIVRELYQAGTNSGLAHHFLIDRDYISGGSLINYKDYYFALTSYGVDLQGIQQYYVQGNLVGYVMRDEDTETGKNTITATPSGSSATVDQTAAHIAGVSDGSVTIAYVRQEDITSDHFQVTFRVNPDTADHGDPPFVWDLVDVTTGDTLFAKQKDQTEGYADPAEIIKGFMIDVIGPTLTVKNVVWDGPDRWLSPIDGGGSGFGGGVFLGVEWTDVNLSPADFGKVVEIRFNADSTAWCDATVFRRDQGYNRGGVGKFPGTVWDVTNPSAPRQLNVCFVEDPRFGDADLKWDPTPNADNYGGREYLFLMNSTYDNGHSYDSMANIYDQPVDMLFAGWFYVRANRTFLQDNATWIWSGNRINTEADVFDFTTRPVSMTPGSPVGWDMNAIRAVPNPYLNQSDYELNQFNRIIRFTNLPSTECTIRIFNLAGELVRTIVKPPSTADDNNSFAVWDLQNSKAIPVASGIYIYNVEAKGIGSKVGKLAVFVEKERLNRF